MFQIQNNDAKEITMKPKIAMLLLSDSNRSERYLGERYRVFLKRCGQLNNSNEVHTL